MSDANAQQPLADAGPRERFRNEWRSNFAVSANAGSGKTTAISERLAAMAMSPEAAVMLPKTAVVTYTKKAAQQIGERARAVLLRRLAEGRAKPPAEPSNGNDLSDAAQPEASPYPNQSGQAALNHLERAFFGTIHGFCLTLAKRHGQALGVNLNPEVVSDGDAACWEEFVEQDPMRFDALSAEQLRAFLRHMPLTSIFGLAGKITASVAKELRARKPAGLPPGPDARALDEIMELSTRAGKSTDALRRNQQNAVEWSRRFREEKTFLPFISPEGSAANIKEHYAQFFVPMKSWLAAASATLAAELSERYRNWRFERGVQTFADQVETALAVLHNEAFLDKIRAEGWRVILDEAQDTDPMQFAVLVEIARPPGAALGTWPDARAGKSGPAPRPGHFCMVGDGQQAIYGSRADVRNFTRHLAAFERGDGGEKLEFSVTFRTPRRAIALFNEAFPGAFGKGNDFNYGLPPAEGAEPPLLQVPYQPLIPGPSNAEGAACRIELSLPSDNRLSVEHWMQLEALQLAAFFKARGPAGVGAKEWGDVCLLAPANPWLVTVGKILKESGLKVALQARRNRCGDNPVYAWMTGLLAVICDPDNAFEWFGVLREVFGVSDALLAAEIREPELDALGKGGRNWLWETPEEHPRPLRDALETMRPFVLRANDGGLPLARFAEELARACKIEERALAISPGGELADELHRLLANAAALGLEGAGPREWLAHLLDGLDEQRPTGKAERDAINLVTSHSSKGLEWDVVIPLGFWRPQQKPPVPGMQLVPEVPGVGPVVYFDTASMPEDMRVSRDREAKREQARLLYVTLTRAKKRLVIPWGGGGFGKAGNGASFADIFGRVDLIEALPLCESEAEIADAAGVAQEGGADEVSSPSGNGTPPLLAQAELPPLPARVLPHQLAHFDAVRGALHEATADDLRPARDGDEAIEYGLWWHGVMESLPWDADDVVLSAYFEKSLEAARERCGEAGLARGREELERFQAGETLRELREPRWTREAELPIFAPANEAGDTWVDGIMDMVIHDAAANEARVVDWKTNRRRAGESDDALLARLADEYAPQLRAYGRCVTGFFPKARVRLFVYSSAAGKVIEIAGE
ncbi:UvrD-helicase domain-containing protein [Ereboglobus luteus]|uniref:DNA 3'-5' helicase n=1 Tax=Ereboglobus luteus TaxID=1796921 RepID=A0A2U8E2L3_9BACT|nr:UvrD-helicase domain-containing protein [Ereboglobus luteus]AWI09071.1 hypothetical protein CKA38_07305 [Ereboglobus luteus]